MNPTQQQRITTLDVLRGFAVLGILIMNIQSFAMLSISYDNPSTLDSFFSPDMYVWIFSSLFANGKFMAIFSLLFGASALLIIQKTKSKGLSSAKHHYKRNFWLLIIGLFHAYVIWFGDILVSYALCSFVLYLWRNASVKKLIISGAFILFVHVLLCIAVYFLILELPEQLPEEDEQSWLYEELSPEMETYIWRHGSWEEQFSLRIEFAIIMQTFLFIYYILWYSLGWMLIGMALYKSGFLIGNYTEKLYRRVFIYGLISGVSLTFFGIIDKLEHISSLAYSSTLSGLWDFFGAIPLVFAYISLIILWCKNNFATKFRSTISNVGRMSLTSYLSQSLICSIIFYYFGFFEQLTRWEQLVVVLAIWLMQIIFSQWWLQKFTFGPCEYAWRYLTNKRCRKE